MTNFKNKTHRASIKKLDPCNNWSVPKSILKKTIIDKEIKVSLKNMVQVC
jgi:hypothetical protein